MGRFSLAALRRSRPLFAAAAGLAAGGAALVLAALLAAPLGLGSQESFWFYRHFGVTRHDLLAEGLAWTAALLAAALFLSPACPPCAARLAAAGARLGRLAAAAEGALAGRGRLALALLAAVLLVDLALLGGFGSSAVLMPDSPGYLAFSPTRSAGYPLFLTTLRRLTGSLRWLVPLQLNLMLLSFAALGLALRRAGGSALAGLAVGLVLMVDRGLYQFSFFVISESLFIALLSLHAACALGLMARFRWPLLWLCFAALAAAAIVRPAGYPLFLAVPLLALLLPGRRLAVAAVGGGVLAAFLGAASLAQFAASGVLSPQSFGGITLVGHVAPLIRADMPFADRELLERIDRGLQPYRQGFAHRGYPRDYWQATADGNDPILYGVLWPEIARRVAETRPGDSPGRQLQAVNDLAMGLALAAIAADPPGYLAHLLAHFYGMWDGILVLPEDMATVLGRQRAQMGELLARFPGLADWGLDAAAPAPPAGRLGAVFDGLGAMVGALRLLVLAGAVLGAAAGWRHLPAGRTASSPRRAAMVYLSLQIQAYFLFIAAVQVALSRYSAALEPFVLALVALLLVRPPAGREGED